MGHRSSPCDCCEGCASCMRKTYWFSDHSLGDCTMVKGEAPVCFSDPCFAGGSHWEVLQVLAEQLGANRVIHGDIFLHWRPVFWKGRHVRTYTHDIVCCILYIFIWHTIWHTHTHTNIDFRTTICSNVLFSGGFLLTFYHTWWLAGQHIIIWKQRIWTVGIASKIKAGYQNVIHLQVVQFQVLRKENKSVQDCNGLSHCGSTVWCDASYLNCYS